MRTWRAVNTLICIVGTALFSVLFGVLPQCLRHLRKADNAPVGVQCHQGERTAIGVRDAATEWGDVLAILGKAAAYFAEGLQ